MVGVLRSLDNGALRGTGEIRHDAFWFRTFDALPHKWNCFPSWYSVFLVRRGGPSEDRRSSLIEHGRMK